MHESRLKTFLKLIKYKLVLLIKPRKNRVYTQFFRFPNQYRVLIERVIPAHIEQSDNVLEIVIFACCNGAEAYTLSSILQQHFPNLKYRIRGFDIVQEVIEQARTATYTKDDVYCGPFVEESFVEQTLERDEEEKFVVKGQLSKPVSFAVGDMLDEKFINSLGKVDLVYAQNVLFHLPPQQSRKAFTNLITMLKPTSTLFINGMDTGMRIKLTKKYQLKPLDYLIEEIHQDARIDRGQGWAAEYWGREPFSQTSKDWMRKYCTIYTS